MIEGLDQFKDTEYEECGVVLSNFNDRLFVVKVPNLSTAQQTHNFAIDAATIRRVLRDHPGCGFVGVLHTHPDADPTPSGQDITGVPIPLSCLSYFVYEPVTGELRHYSPGLGIYDEKVGHHG